VSNLRNKKFVSGKGAGVLNFVSPTDVGDKIGKGEKHIGVSNLCSLYQLNSESKLQYFLVSDD
ncbi:MAG: hypothetical protein COX30_00735, partial [Candidatus Moranbacteria bacterium CG23_combo_of_CG06-09_8_20_14_all_39_10]